MKTILELFVIAAVALTWLFVYQNYWDDIVLFFTSAQPTYIVHIGDVAVEVTVADDQAERERGLSGVESLGDFDGKLFIFDTADYQGIWMKDMLMPIDVLWFDDNLRLIHIEQNMMPSSYPQVYRPAEPARFVLETNAYFVRSLKIKLGDRLILPPEILPTDIRNTLQEQK